MTGRSLLSTVWLLLAGMFLLAHDAPAQAPAPPRPHVEVAVEPAALLTLPTGSLESIRGSAPCALGFEPVTSVNFAAGVRAGYVLDTGRRTFGLRAIQLAVGYDDLSSLFETTETSYEAFDDVSGRYTSASTRYTAEFSLAYLRLALMADFTLAGNLMLRAGPSLGMALAASSIERAAIVSPSNATFLDKTQERTIAEGTGDLESPGARIGVGASVAHRLRLGKRLFAEPSVGVDYAFTDVQPAWTPFTVRAGISVGYAAVPDPAPAVPVPTDTVRVAVVEPRTERAERPFTATPAIMIAADRLPVEFRRQIVARYVPVLPSIFFSRNTATLDGRYHAIAGEGAVAFDENALSSNAERAHYNTLNVFGRRLVANPRVRVTITGTTSRDEEGRENLATGRAQAVADYFASAWGIARNRITVRSRIDPAVPSNSDYPEGLEENRRVEMEFSDDVIYRPLQLRSVEPTTEPASIPFRVSAVSSSRIARWRADIATPAGTLATLDGDGEPDGIATWELESADREKVLEAGRASYRLRVFDSAGRSVATEPRDIPLRLDTTISVASSPGQPDNSAEFLLVTFDFDRAELTRRGRLELNAILDRIGPASSVSITGYTDPVGETEHNRALALERARKVASLMPAGVRSEFRGASPDEAPYSRSSPEGRFLSRTVRVVVTNPK